MLDNQDSRSPPKPPIPARLESNFLSVIRDFYDLHHAAQNLGLTAEDPDLLDLLRRKLAIPGNPPIDLSPSRIDQLRRQRDARLQPVLRPQDFDRFDLDHAVRIARQIADKLG